MSLADQYFNAFGYGGGSVEDFVGYKPKKYSDPSFASPSRKTLSSNDNAALQKPQREVAGYERPDVNAITRATTRRAGIDAAEIQPGSPDEGQNFVEVAGALPGRILERPLGILDQLGKDLGGLPGVDAALKMNPLGTVLNAEDTITGASKGGIPIVSDVAKFATDAFNWVESVPSAIANQSMIESLATGVRENWQDTDGVAQRYNTGKFVGNIADAGGVGFLVRMLTGSDKSDEELAKHPMTWADLKLEARKRGFHDSDVEDYMTGRKQSYDFGDKALSSDQLTNLALHFGSDPMNLIFAGGASLKLGRGVTGLAKAIKLGSESEILTADLGKAAFAAKNGVTAETNYMGIAQHLGELSRGASRVPGYATAVDALSAATSVTGKAAGVYKKAAYISSGAQIGGLALEKVTGPNPLLQPFYDFNERAWENRPLSESAIFSMAAAFHVPVHAPVAKAVKGVKMARNYIQLEQVYDGVAEKYGTSVKGLEEALGGREAMNAHIESVVAKQESEKALSKQGIRELFNLQPGSKAEQAMLVQSFHDMVYANVAIEFAEGRVNAARITQQLEDWYAYRHKGNEPLNDIAIQWDGPAALSQAAEFNSSLASFAKIMRETNTTLGYADLPTKDAIAAQRATFKQVAVDGQVPIEFVRDWLSRHPGLIREGRGFTGGITWESYLRPDAPATVTLESLQGKMRPLMKGAPTAREMSHEYESREAMLRENPPPTDAPAWLEGGGVAVGTGRLHESMGLPGRTVRDAQVARGHGTVEKFETNVAETLRDNGFAPAQVEQTVGYRNGEYEPSLKIQMTSLQEARVAGARLGKDGKQTRTTVSVSGAESLAREGLTPNGHEFVLQLPSTAEAVLARVGKILRNPMWELEIADSTGQVRILTKGSTDAQARAVLTEMLTKLEAVPALKDKIGASRVVSSAHPAYIEILGAGKDATPYQSVLKSAVDGGDRRAASSWGKGLRGETYRGTRPVRESGADAGGPVEPVEQGFVAGTSENIDPASLREGDMYVSLRPDEAALLATEGMLPKPPERLAWLDGQSGKRINGVTNPGELPGGLAGNVIVRAKVKPSFLRSDPQGGAYVSKKIAINDLEALGADGQWHPVGDAYPTPLSVDPALQAAHDLAPAVAGEDPLARAAQNMDDLSYATATKPGSTEAGSLEALVAAGPGAETEAALLQQEIARAAANEPVRARVLFMADRDARVAAEWPLNRINPDRPAEAIAALEQVEKALREELSPYQVSELPKIPLQPGADAGQIAARYLRDRGLVGDLLAHSGPLSYASRGLNFLFKGRSNAVQSRAARQAAFNGYQPYGVTPKQVNAFIDGLNERAASIVVRNVPVFRGVGGMLPRDINKAAVETFGAEAVARMKADGLTPTHILDRSMNRFVRTLDSAQLRGGKTGQLARVVDEMWGGYQTSVGTPMRILTKTAYPLFRFFLDPRWWAMNFGESGFIAILRYGTGSSESRLPSMAERIHAGDLGRSGEMFDNTGFTARQHTGTISQVFDQSRPESVLEVVRAMGATDPALVSLKKHFGNAEDDIVDGVEDMMYGFDAKGPRAHWNDKVAEEGATWTPEERAAIMPALDKMFKKNEQTFNDINQMFHGNPERSIAERVANSYWLYWPISYQIKAAKWLWDVMSHRALGKETNLAGAALYGHYNTEVKKALATDPEFAQWAEDHKHTFQLIQMMFPLTPEDIGVSLSKPAKGFLGMIGVGDEYFRDPADAVDKLTKMGIRYTVDEIKTVWHEWN